MTPNQTDLVDALTEEAAEHYLHLCAQGVTPDKAEAHARLRYGVPPEAIYELLKRRCEQIAP